MPKMIKEKQGFKKVGNFIYSQFIYIDVNKENQKTNFKRGCKERDFKEWLLEEKNISICPADFWKAPDKITELLKEYLKINLSGWCIPCDLIKEDELLIKTENEEYILNTKTNKKREFNIK